MAVSASGSTLPTDKLLGRPLDAAEPGEDEPALAAPLSMESISLGKEGPN